MFTYFLACHPYILFYIFNVFIFDVNLRPIKPKTISFKTPETSSGLKQCVLLPSITGIRKFMNIHPLMCEAIISLPTSEETSGEVTIFLVTSPEVSN